MKHTLLFITVTLIGSAAAGIGGALLGGLLSGGM
jgi:hypothetical protein